jgi:hypothetical protein
MTSLICSLLRSLDAFGVALLSMPVLLSGTVILLSVGCFGPSSSVPSLAEGVAFGDSSAVLLAVPWVGVVSALLAVLLEHPPKTMGMIDKIAATHKAGLVRRKECIPQRYPELALKAREGVR